MRRTPFVAVIAASVLSFVQKWIGYQAPQDVLERPRIARITRLLPIALLGALVATQTAADGTEVVLDARLAGALMGIQAIKGVEVGDGFLTAARPGTQAHDEIMIGDDGRVHRVSNRAGGIEGGMSIGDVLRVRAAMKPIATVPKALRTVDIATRDASRAHHQRSDVCAVPAAGVVAEAMVALVLAGADVSTAGLADEGDVVDDSAGSDCPPQAVSVSAKATLSVPAWANRWRRRARPGAVRDISPPTGCPSCVRASRADPAVRCPWYARPGWFGVYADGLWSCSHCPQGRAGALLPAQRRFSRACAPQGRVRDPRPGLGQPASRKGVPGLARLGAMRP